MNQTNTGFEVKAKERQSWWSIALVWIGAMICVPCLMIGGVLGSSLNISSIVISVIIGYGIICIYMSLIGIQSCDTGLPTSILATSSLGEKGARYIISLLLTLSCIGWFGIQSAVCGESFSSMIAAMTGFEIPVWICSIVWGAIMLATACFGFKGLKYLNYVAVPLLLIVCIYGLVAGIAQNDGGSVLSGYEPATNLGIVFGISMTVATFALGGVISADYCRFAKSRGDVIKSSVIGVLPAGLLMLLMGAIMSIVTGYYNVSDVLASVGVPFLGLLALVLATWTTNVTNAYSGGLALSNLLGVGESKFKITTAIAGGIGTILAAVGLLSRFETFLSLLSAFIPPLAGIIIADYWIIGRGKKENFKIRTGFSAPGIIAFAVGAIVACMTGGTFASFKALAFLNFPFFVGPVNGIVVSIVIYVILRKLMPQTDRYKTFEHVGDVAAEDGAEADLA